MSNELDNNLEELEAEESGNTNESKTEKFARLAVSRMNKALKAIELLEPLANRASYDYTEEQVAKMFTALRTALDSAETKFQPKEAKKEQSFSF